MFGVSNRIEIGFLSTYYFFFIATWVDRFSVDTSEVWDEEDAYQLTSTQKSKFLHFFTYLLDHDHDDLIGEQDFEALIEVNYSWWLLCRLC